jgi:signal transduction histidine kinase
MESILFLTVVFLLLEYFELRWQQGGSMYDIFQRGYSIYRYSIFYYFLYNPTFILSIFLIFLTNNFSFTMLSIVILKFIDIFFKLYMFQKQDNGEDISGVISKDVYVSDSMRYFNMFVFPFVFLIDNWNF